MKEQTIKIKINGEDREVLAGNAALLRFRKAGGDMSLISSIDGEDTDALFDSIDAICNLISVNLVEPQSSLNQVPWLVGSN